MSETWECIIEDLKAIAISMNFSLAAVRILLDIN